MTQGTTKGVPIDTDATMAANSNQLVPSQAAVVSYVGVQVATKVASVTGTLNRISSTGGLNPVINIDAAYVGQASITTLGTITTGTWTGTNIALNKGGTNASLTASNGGIFYSTATAGAILAGTATANQMLQSGASTTPAWSTSTYPATNAVSTLLYASSTNVMGALATAIDGILVTSHTGVPSILAGPGATGKVLQSNSILPPSYSTATYPSVATGTGTILRADGTNWVATTSTYPTTNAVSTLLYASSANVMGALATANSGVLTTDASGIPSIDTTNFVRQTTGMQMKGNNTNTAPPAGFIGEQIRSAIAQVSAVTLSSLTAKTVTSISLTAGIWDVSGICSYVFSVAGTLIGCSISATDNTNGTSGDNAVFLCATFNTVDASSLCCPAFRVTLSGTTTYYLVADAQFASGTGKAFGRISATRVG